ncbi:MAG: hypothetical protein HC905_02305 [Bacteroidales bacterium]|nr:hypothetical protein [Bacteroidales bacterium]
MKLLSGTKTFFGHQDATGYGVGWSNDDDRSDVKDVCGSYPALGAWGVSGIAAGQDYSRDKYRVEKFYNLGGLNTFELATVPILTMGSFTRTNLPQEETLLPIYCREAQKMPGLSHN